MSAMDGVLVAGLASLVGLSELLARYRADPRRLVTSSSSWLYVAINGLAGIAALAIIKTFGWTFGGRTPAAQDVTQLLVAGIGAAALFRSSLFIARIGNTDVGIGPSTVLTTLLQTVDRDVDRLQARQRAVQVSDIMKDVSFEKAYETLPTYCLALMQNLPAEEQQALGVAIRMLRQSTMSEEIKTLNLGLELMNKVGPGVLQAAVNALGSRIQHGAADELRESGGLGPLVEAQQVVTETIRDLAEGNAGALAERVLVGARVLYRGTSVVEPSLPAAWAPVIEEFKTDWPTGVSVTDLRPEIAGNGQRAHRTADPSEGEGRRQTLELRLALGSHNEWPTRERMRGRAEVSNKRLIHLDIDEPQHNGRTAPAPSA